jgi:hypothetical protein
MRWGTKPCIDPIQPHQGPLANILKDVTSISALSLSQYMLSPGMFNGDGLIDFDILETLQQISIAKANAANLSLAERKIVSQVIYLTNHRLLMEISDVNHNQAPGFEFCQAFLVASTLYLNLMIREIPRRARVHYPLTEKLQIIMNNNFPGKVIEGLALEVIMWIIFIGAAANPPEERGNYFINLLALISENLGIREEHGLKNRLREVVWIDDICDGYLSNVWAEMMDTTFNSTVGIEWTDV